MRLITLVTALVTALALAATASALAQSGTGGGTDPINKGSTGWTGGHPETGGATTDSAKPGAQTTGQAAKPFDQAEAKDQPLMATGVDLNGPPMRFAPSRTPE